MLVFSISQVFFEPFEIRVTDLFISNISSKICWPTVSKVLDKSIITSHVNFCPQMLLGFGKPAVISRGQSNGLVGNQPILSKQNSRPEVFCNTTGVLKKISKLTGKYVFL